jgi:peptidoglycan-associated lipoprotein
MFLVIAGLVGGCGPKPEVEQVEEPMEPVEEVEPQAEPPEDTEPGMTDKEREIEWLASLGFETIYFDTDKWNIREDARESLKRNAAIMEENPEITLTIEGHCDERNTVEYNLALGERRATAARDYLVRLGVDAERMRTISYGEERPVAFGHDESSWKLNRRAEFKASK